MIRSLQRHKYRRQERAFVIEGSRAVQDVLTLGIAPRAVYIRDGFDLDRMAPVPAGIPVRRVVGPLFDTLTDVPHPQGILAVMSIPDETAIPLATVRSEPLVLVVDAVRDPGNLGTLLRSAAGAGADQVVICPETVDPYHPRAVRAAMGAHFRVRLSHGSWDTLAVALETYEIVALADASGDSMYDQVAWDKATALIVGGEAFGPTAAARRCANLRVAIPLRNGVESLNAGVAGSLLLFEAARRRRRSITGDEPS